MGGCGEVWSAFLSRFDLKLTLCIEALWMYQRLIVENESPS